MNISQPVETEPIVMDETVEKTVATVLPSTRRRRRIAPMSFGLGMLVGIVGFAAYTALNSAPLDQAAVRAAARDGTLDAIATLQAGGSPSSSTAPDATAVAQVSSAFTIREANRIGDPKAPVMIFEFADF
ncbi:MAG TPA: hypothetical protein VJG32_00520, partial [Anaerolineae bacterium]|nr:hypothetical protein [Anaerolineae bacterium]